MGIPQVRFSYLKDRQGGSVDRDSWVRWEAVAASSLISETPHVESKTAEL